MNNHPLISCIIIFYNAQRFLNEAIESVINQTYNNWELLLVDDGSNDESSIIALNYADKNLGKIKYFSHENHQNKGMSSSRNLGVKNAKGKYIAFLDGDDVWLPQKLERQINIMNNYPEAGMLYGRSLIWYSWTNDPNDKNRDYFLSLNVEPNKVIQPPELFNILLQNKAQTPTTCSVLIRRDVFDKIGYFEDSFKGLYEDQVFFSKVHLKIPVFVSDEHWSNYRQHDENSSIKAEKDQNYTLNRLPFLYWLKNYLTSQNLNKSILWRKFRKELWLCEHPRIYHTLETFYLLKQRALKNF